MENTLTYTIIRKLQELINKTSNTTTLIIPQTSSSTISTTITTGGVAQTILSSNVNRKGFEIQNNSNGDLRISFGATASLTNGFKVGSGIGYSSTSYVSTSQVSVFGSTTGQQFSYQEY